MLKKKIVKNAAKLINFFPKGANINLPNQHGVTPLETALEVAQLSEEPVAEEIYGLLKDVSEIVEVLQQAGLPFTLLKEFLAHNVTTVSELTEIAATRGHQVLTLFGVKTLAAKVKLQNILLDPKKKSKVEKRKAKSLKLSKTITTEQPIWYKSCFEKFCILKLFLSSFFPEDLSSVVIIFYIQIMKFLEIRKLPIDSVQFYSTIHKREKSVFHGKLDSKYQVAIKVQLLEKPENEETIEWVLDGMTNFHSDYILSSHGYAFINQYFVSIFEYCENGSVFQYLSRSRDREELDPQSNTIDAWLAFRFSLDIIKGIRYLHSYGLVHSQLSTSHVLIQKDFNCKLVVSKFNKINHFLSSDKLSNISERRDWAYTAPELMMKAENTQQTDIFSFGIILWEIWTSLFRGEYRTPYSEFELGHVGMLLIKTAEGLRPSIPAGSYLHFINLYEKCDLNFSFAKKP